MQQQKIGAFLRELRRQQNMTQEQFAERMGVSNRSVSRWETGTNLPDLDLLIQIADHYEVALDELLDGERKESVLDRKMEETVRKVANYSNSDKIAFTKRMHILFMAGVAAMAVYLALDALGLSEAGGIYDHIAGFSLGFAAGMLLLGVLFTGKYMARLRAIKLRLLRRGEP